MSDVKFKGLKLAEITLTHQNLADIASTGHTIAQCGVWDDGTPAFTRVVLSSEFGEYSKPQVGEIPSMYRVLQ